MRNSRHIPYPDWMQNVTGTCIKSQFLAHTDKQCSGKLICQKWYNIGLNLGLCGRDFGVLM